MDSPFPMRTPGERLAACRKTRNLLQLDVAEALGIDNSRLSRIENDSGDISFTELDALCTFYDIDANLVLWGMDKSLTPLGFSGWVY